MIATIDVTLQSANPALKLFPMRAFQDSPSSFRIRNVPKRIGDWNINSVTVTVLFPDGSQSSAEAKLTGGVYVATVPGCGTLGTVENGYTVFASGKDENGNEVTGYILGKGDVEILDPAGISHPGEGGHFVSILSGEPETPKEGDLWQVSGTWYVYQDGESWALGDDTGLISQLSVEIQTKQAQLTNDQLKAVNSGITAAKVAQYNSTAAHVYDWKYSFMEVTPYIQEPVWVFSNLTPPTGYEITTDPAYIGGDEWHAMAYPISAGLGDVFNIFANAPEDATVLNFSVNEPDFGHVFSFTATLKQYQKAEVFNFQNNQISVTNGDCDLTLEVLQKSPDKMNDLWVMIDATSISSDISLALGEGFHPHTSRDADYKVAAGTYNLYMLTEYRKGHFMVSRWTETEGGAE